ncbi:MAG: hypothetical protein RIR53_371 [Bacteroidota bacterium]|jgi:hypothetical protein
MIRLSTLCNTVVLALALALSAHTVSAQRITWIKTLTGPSFDVIDAMHVAADGSCSIVGTFSDSMDAAGIDLQAIGNYDIFTARFNGKGNLITALAHGGYDFDEAGSIVVDNRGNTYVSGSFIDAAVVGGEQIETFDAFSSDMFVAKISNQGIMQWVKVFGSEDYDEGAPCLAVDSTGNVYVGGGTGADGKFGTKSYRSAGKLDAFVAKLNSSGEVLWVQGFGSAENDQVSQLQVTPTGDRIFAVGTFIGSVNFGNTNIESFAGKSDIFVRSMNATGQPAWTKRIGSSEVDVTVGTSITREGSLLLTGPMRLTTTFDTQTLKADGENQPDVYVARVNKDGAFELLRRYGSTFEEISTSIACDAKGNMLVGGTFDSTTTIETFQEDSKGANDGFVMRLLSNGDVDWVRTFGGPYEDYVTAVGIDGKGIPYMAGAFDTWALFDNQRINGVRFDDSFVAALDCGPSTQIRPLAQEIKLCEGMDKPITAKGGYPSYEWFVNGTKDSETRFTFSTKNLKTGTYTVYCRIRGYDECIKSTDTIRVVVTPGLPVPTITRTGDDLTCSADGVNYQWYREGKKIAGATSRTVKVQGDGTYRVQISDTAGCEQWSTPFVVGSTSVDDLIEGSTISLFPNPTSGMITIAGAEGVEITVTDMMGRTVASVMSASSNESIEIDGATGVYVVRLRYAGRSESILVQKR